MDDFIDKTYERIELLIEMQHYDVAINQIKASLEKNPNDDYLYSLWAWIEIQNKRYLNGEKLCKKALQLNAESYEAKYYLTCDYIDSEKYDQALGLLKDLLKDVPEEPSLYYLLATTYFGKDIYDKALKAINKALYYDSNKSEYLVTKSRIYRFMNQPGRADFYANMALEKSPDAADAVVEKGWRAIDDNKPAEAKEFFVQAMSIDPTNEYAKEGMKYALKAENWFYNLFFRFSLFMQALTRSKRALLWLGIMFAVTLFQGIATKLFLLGGMVGLAYFLLIVFVSTIDPLSNLLLATNPYGRHVLRKEDFLRSYFAVGIWVFFFIVLVLNLYFHKTVLPAFSILMLVFPIKRTIERRKKSSFVFFLALSVIMVLTSLYFCVGTWLDIPIAGLVIFLYVISAIFTSWMTLFWPA